MDTLKEVRRKVWIHVSINLLAFPGLGTLMAGRRVGWIQAIVMVVGFILTVGFMLSFFAAAFGYLNGSIPTEEQFHQAYRRYAWAGIIGAILCVVAWVWSLISSLSMLADSAPPTQMTPKDSP